MSERQGLFSQADYGKIDKAVAAFNKSHTKAKAEYREDEAIFPASIAVTYLDKDGDETTYRYVLNTFSNIDEATKMLRTTEFWDSYR